MNANSMNANSVNTNFMFSDFLAEVIVIVETKSFHFEVLFHSS